MQDPRKRFEARDVRHGEVEKHQIGTSWSGGLDRSSAVGCFGDHGKPPTAVEDATEHRPVDGVVVDQQHRERLAGDTVWGPGCRRSAGLFQPRLYVLYYRVGRAAPVEPLGEVTPSRWSSWSLHPGLHPLGDHGQVQ